VLSIVGMARICVMQIISEFVHKSDSAETLTRIEMDWELGYAPYEPERF
jgi:hypothetical protein